MESSTQTFDTTFAQDIVKGLNATPRRLSSQYFYDEKGSQLFQQIMRMESYYLTDAELEIFSRQGEAVVKACSPDGSPFRLIEFGAGDGMKTKVLLRHLLERDLDFIYAPIDISATALEGLVKELADVFPALKVEPLQGEYFAALDALSSAGHVERKVILFMGSNIGNFQRAGAISFLSALRDHASPGDRAMIGFDLKKNPLTILRAYDDPAGITREFNLNLLDRINRELGGDFDRAQWQHYATYDPLTGETRSYLLPQSAQQVCLKVLGETFSFAPWEAVWTELSQKFDLEMIQDLAQSSGFVHLEGLLDSRQYFMEALWECQA